MRSSIANKYKKINIDSYLNDNCNYTGSETVSSQKLWKMYV